MYCLPSSSLPKHFPAFAAADAGATAVGQVIGVMLALLALVKCVNLMRRKTTSALCVSPLFAVVVTWFVSGCLVVFPIVTGVYLRLWFDGALILLLLVGIVLGCVGLGLYKSGVFVQGRKQAVWGILLGSIIVVIRISSMVSTISSPAFSPVIAAERDGIPFAKGGEVIEFPNLNCKLVAPSPGWVRVKDPKSLNPDATLALRRASPQALAVLIAEPVELGVDALISVTKGNVEARFGEHSITDEKTETVNGIEWHSFSTEIPKKGFVAAELTRFWVASYAGHSYQWVLSVLQRDGDTAGEAGKALLSGFHVLDPSRTSAGTAALKDAKEETDGFQTRLSALGWRPFVDGDVSLNGNSLCAIHPSPAFFIVDTMPLGTMEVAMEDIFRAFIMNYAALGPKFPQLKLEKAKIRGADEAVRFSTESVLDKQSFAYRGTVARSGQRAFLFLGWQSGTGTKDPRHLDAAFQSIEVPTAAGPFPPPRDEAMARKRSLLLHSIGLEFANRADWPKALKAFTLSYEISPHNDPTLESIVVAMEETGDIRGAIELLEKHHETVSKNGALGLALGRLKQRMGDTEGALVEYDKAFKAGAGKEPDLLAYLNILIDGNRAGDAVKVVDEFVKKGASTKVRRWQAETYVSAGNPKRAMEIYEEILAKPPYDPLSAYGLGETANNEDDYERAAGVVAGLLKAGNDTARTRMIEGWSLFGRKSWREAKTAFEKARAFSPDDPTIASALTRVSAMLGEGDNSLVKTPIDPVPLPSALADAVATIGREAAVPDGASVCYLMRVSAFHFEPGKPVTSTTYRRAKVVTQAGVGDFSTLVFQFDPLSERIHVNKLVVTDEKGKVTAEGLPEEQYVVDLSADAGEATHSKVLRVVVPGLKPGCTLEVMVTRQDRSPATEFPYERLICTTSVPTLAEAVIVSGDIARVRVVPSAAAEKAAKVIEAKGSRSWLVRQPVVWKPESNLPFAESYLPVLRLGPAKGDWADVGRDYLKQIDSLLKPDAKAKAIATEVAGKLKNDDEKIRALAGYVQKNVTYQAIEFGRRARIPKPAERVVSSRYGDCKDQALLLYQLLKSAGVPAQLALIHSDSDVEASLPSLDQFNHMIVQLPGQKAAFVDSTNTVLPAGMLPPALFHRQALVLYPDKPKLERVPERSLFPAENLLIERDVTVAAGGEMEVREKFRLRGYYAMGWREWVSGVQPSERLAAIQRFQSDSRWRVEEFTVEGMDDNSADLVFNFKYAMPPLATSAKPMSVIVPAIWEHEYLDAQFLKERRFPMELLHPVRIESRVKIQLPQAVGASAFKAFERSADSEFGKWKIAASASPTDANVVTVDFEFQSPSGTYPAARYDEWQSFRSKVVEAWRQPLKLE
ncbi:MAG: hypothetical protein RL088_3594 [Verrucomicrobiota bacterium]|jgi:tetratricopeptide (TPR) repeat protein